MSQATSAVTEAAVRGLGRVRRFRLSFLAGQPVGLAGLAGAVGIMLVALLAPVIEPYAPNYQDYNAVLVGPFGSGHLLGTDELGRDELSRLIAGARVSVQVGVLSTLLAVVVGGTLGCIGGYFRGPVDAVIARATDVVLAFPFLILAIAFAVILGPSATNATLALAIAQVPTFIRVARGEVLGLRRLDYVQAAVSIGVPDRVILVRHIVPGIMNSMVVQTTVAIPLAIIGEAVLSFLGLGVAAAHGIVGDDVVGRTGLLRQGASARDLPRTGDRRGRAVVQSARRRTPRRARCEAPVMLLEIDDLRIEFRAHGERCLPSMDCL